MGLKPTTITDVVALSEVIEAACLDGNDIDMVTAGVSYGDAAHTLMQVTDFLECMVASEANNQDLATKVLTECGAKFIDLEN